MVLSCRSLSAVDQAKATGEVKARLPMSPLPWLDHSPHQEEKGHHRHRLHSCEGHADTEVSLCFPKLALYSPGSASESPPTEKSILEYLEFPILAGSAKSQIPRTWLTFSLDGHATEENHTSLLMPCCEKERRKCHMQRKASVTSWLAKRAETGRPMLAGSPKSLKPRQGKYEF